MNNIEKTIATIACLGGLVGASVFVGPKLRQTFHPANDSAEEALGALKNLDSELEIGMNYLDYSEKVREVKPLIDRFYEDDSAEDHRNGGNLHLAFSSYKSGLDDYKDYIDASSSTESYREDSLQRSWSEAHEYISQAEECKSTGSECLPQSKVNEEMFKKLEQAGKELEQETVRIEEQR